MSVYTSFIEDGKITNAKDFLKLCLRNFGIMQEHYQEPLSLESVLEKEFDVETDDSYQRYRSRMDDEYRMLKEVLKKRQDGNLMEEEYNNYIKTITTSLNKYKEYRENEIKRNKVFEKFVNEIKQWQCSPQYENIKKFAIDQCTGAMTDITYYDKQIARYENILVDPRANFEKDKKAEFEMIKQCIDMHAKSINNCVKSLRDRKEFFDGFMEEVNKLDKTN